MCGRGQKDESFTSGSTQGSRLTDVHRLRRNISIYFSFQWKISSQIALNLRSKVHFKISHLSALGKPVYTNIDEFPENFRTAFDPPPPGLFREKILRFFPKTGPNRTKFATIFLGSEMTPPLLEVFPENHDQNCRF